MAGEASANDERVLLGSISGEDVVFAIASASGLIEPGSQRTFSSQVFTTFTEAIQVFAREHALSLDGRMLILAVAGAVRGDTVRITNGRWFISISGIRSMLRRHPLVLNDVSAVAWSALMLEPKDLRWLDAVRPEAKVVPAQRAVIWIGDGLGAACLAFDDQNRPFVLDGEGGHMTCPAETNEQVELLEPVRKRLGHLSYERALNHLQATAANPTTSSVRDSNLQSVRIGVLGGFAGSVALAYGAWGGVFLAGPGLPLVHGPTGSAIFRERFVAKGRFRGLLANVPISTADRTCSSSDYLRQLAA